MKRLLNPVIFVLAAALVFEEWLWDALKAQLHKLARLPLVAALEHWLGRLNPWGSLLVLCAPVALLFPFKLAALWAFSHGHPMAGSFIFVLAKLAGTASAAYLFDLVRPSALKLRWFAALYSAIIGVLGRAKVWLQTQPLYRRAREVGAALKQSLQLRMQQRTWLRRKVRAARELARRSARSDTV